MTGTELFTLICGGVFVVAAVLAGLGRRKAGATSPLSWPDWVLTLALGVAAAPTLLDPPDDALAKTVAWVALAGAGVCFLAILLPKPRLPWEWHRDPLTGEERRVTNRFGGGLLLVRKSGPGQSFVEWAVAHRQTQGLVFWFGLLIVGGAPISHIRLPTLPDHPSLIQDLWAFAALALKGVGWFFGRQPFGWMFTIFWGFTIFAYAGSLWTRSDFGRTVAPPRSDPYGSSNRPRPVAPAGKDAPPHEHLR